MPAVFTATTAAGGTEVWVTNGLPGGTHLLKDIYPGATSAIPQFDRHLTAINGQALFSATNPATGTEVWVTDGTTAGTHILRYFNPGAGDGGATDIVTLGGKGVFFSYDGTAPTLWTTDGTTGGTHAAGGALPPGFVALMADAVVLGGQILFQGFSGTGYELWPTDSTIGGTHLVRDIDPRVNAAGPLGSSPAGMTVVGSVVVFAAATDTGTELWASDGTKAGTVLLQDIDTGFSSFPKDFTTVGSQCFFISDDEVHGEELSVTDGTPSGTRLVRDIDPGVGGSVPGALQSIALGTKLIFAANDGVRGSELWVSNGAAGGTKLLKDLSPGSDGSDPSHFIAAGGKVVFQCPRRSALICG